MNEEYIANAERRRKIADDMAWSSGYAAGRAAARADTAALDPINAPGDEGIPTGSHEWQPTARADTAALVKAAFLAGVRRGASDGMEAYPEVADDYLLAALEADR